MCASAKRAGDTLSHWMEHVLFSCGSMTRVESSKNTPTANAGILRCTEALAQVVWIKGGACEAPSTADSCLAGFALLVELSLDRFDESISGEVDRLVHVVRDLSDGDRFALGNKRRHPALFV